MRYVHAKCDEDYETHSYRIYMTDAVNAAAQNRYLVERWYDIISKPIDNRSGDEIAEDVIRRLGLSLKGGEPNND